MGILADTLKPPSAYRVKKDQPNLWADTVDRIHGAVCPAHLTEIEVWLEARPLDWPDGWIGDLLEIIERRREELAEEDIMHILRDRFDFI